MALHRELPKEFGAIDATTDKLNISTIVTISRTLSEEIVLDRLIDKLMPIAVEHSGATRGLLILLNGNEARIAAEAISKPESVEVIRLDKVLAPIDAPLCVINFAMQTGEQVILEDAWANDSKLADEYLRQKRARSVLCLPMLKHSRLIGALLLENNIAPHIFIKNRVILMEFLAAQAAVSLYNAQLYADLERENRDYLRAQERLRRSEAFLVQAQRLTLTGSVWWEVSTGEITWSEESFRLMGYPPTTKPTVELILKRCHPDDIGLVKETITRLAREGTNDEFRHRLLMPDGSIKHINVVLHNASPAPGKLEYCGAVTDITEQVAAKASLERALANVQKSETEYRTTLEAIPTHVWYALPDGSSNFQNQRWLDYVGFSAEDASSWRWRQTVHPHDVDRYLKRWYEIKASEESGETEARFRRFDGVYRWFLIRVVPVRDASGQVVRWYGINTDIEDLKQAQERLKTSLTEKEILLKEVHHRVKNNLQMISSLLSLQVAHITDPSVAELFVESRNRVRSMALVHENLYGAGDFARIAMDSHIQKLCAHLVRVYGLASRNVVLTTEIDDVVLNLDRAISTGLIINELVSNALKHAFPGVRSGHVFVALKKDSAGRCILRVRDDGTGFPLNFDVTRADSLGLRLVYNLTLQLHGEIALSKNNGTTLAINFPADDSMETSR